MAGSLRARVGTWVREHTAEASTPVTAGRDTTPALGRAGSPAPWRRAADTGVGLHRPGWADARWSSIFRLRTDYASAPAPDPERIAAANRRGRRGPVPAEIQGPFLQAPVWTWEIPVYFWFGGMAAGATFVAAGADLAGDRGAARLARAVALGALLPCPPLLISDLGRPERFYNMLRIFKPRSPMSMGTYALSAFGGLSFLSVAADVLGADRAARRLGGANVPVAAYLGSYTGVLLAVTAVPVWSRSRELLGPIFVASAVMAGGSATRLTLTLGGRGPEDGTRRALARIEDGAIAAELVLSAINERRLGPLGEVLHTGLGAAWFTRARGFGAAALGARVLSTRSQRLEHLTSACSLAAALCYRFAWVRSGQSSAQDDAAVAANARRDQTAAGLNVIAPQRRGTTTGPV